MHSKTLAPALGALLLGAVASQQGLSPTTRGPPARSAVMANPVTGVRSATRKLWQEQDARSTRGMISASAGRPDVT